MCRTTPFLFHLSSPRGCTVGGACACSPPRKANGRLLLGDVAARRLQRRTRVRSRYFSPTSLVSGLPNISPLAPLTVLSPLLDPSLALFLSLARTPLSSVPVTSGSSQATPPHDERQRQRRLDGDAKNGVEESYADGETNQGLTNGRDWSTRSSDTQRARARDKLPHTPGLLLDRGKASSTISTTLRACNRNGNPRDTFYPLVVVI